MTDSVRVRAAAKVNLHLRVYGRRNDGFHGILSVFQAISLFDAIVIRSLKESDTIEIDGDFDCPAIQTTVYKAAVAFREATGSRTGIRISVEKRIPAGAGLGGGSSDAAATLLGLESLLCGGMRPQEIQSLGVGIGSDVPFFQIATAAIVAGRGEAVAPIEARTDFSIVLAFPGESVSTTWAYSMLDAERPDDSAEPDPGELELREAYRGEITRWPFANSFESLVGRARRGIREAKGILLASGASFAGMSGSGNCVFGVFENEGRSQAALTRLKDANMDACAASPLARRATLD